MIEELEKRFFARAVEVYQRSPGLFDRLRNIFFAAEFLAKDLDRISPECRCQDAIAHLDGRCTSCATASAQPNEGGSSPGKGCPAQVESLQVDLRHVREALKQGTAALQPEEETMELKDELTLIDSLIRCLGSALASLKQDAIEFQATCSNEALRRLKQRSGELRVYSGDFFRTLNIKDSPSRAIAAAQDTRFSNLKSRFIQLSIVAVLSLFIVNSAAAQEFTYKVQQDRFKGHRDGELIISASGLDYRAKSAKDSRTWSFTDIKLLEILSPTRLRVWTYKDRKLLLGRDESLTFKIVEGQVDQKVSDFLRDRIGRPLVTSLTDEESTPLTQIPVKHSHRFGGCEGTLKVYSDRLIYEAQDGHDSRSWRWTDIRSVGRSDVYRFDVETFEPQVGASSRSFNFILKEQMPDRTYDLIWSRVFRLTPLIRVDEKTSVRYDR